MLRAQPAQRGHARDAVRVGARVPAAPLPGGVGGHGLRAVVAVRVRRGEQPLGHQGPLHGFHALVGDGRARGARVGPCGRHEPREVHHGLRGRGRGGLAEPGGDALPHAGHREAAGVDLGVGPLLVPDHRTRAPPVGAADRRRGRLYRLQLGGGPGILAVAEVDAFEAVEAGVAVGVVLVGRRQRRRLGHHGAQHVVVAQSGVVGAAVADQVDGAVLGDHAVAEGAGKVGAAFEAQADGRVGAGGHRVVDHHAVDRAPCSLRVPVVGAPAGVLDHLHAFVP